MDFRFQRVKIHRGQEPRLLLCSDATLMEISPPPPIILFPTGNSNYSCNIKLLKSINNTLYTEEIPSAQRKSVLGFRYFRDEYLFQHENQSRKSKCPVGHNKANRGSNMWEYHIWKVSLILAYSEQKFEKKINPSISSARGQAAP